jgi:hypothetical protein
MLVTDLQTIIEIRKGRYAIGISSTPKWRRLKSTMLDARVFLVPHREHGLNYGERSQMYVGLRVKICYLYPTLTKIGMSR